MKKRENGEVERVKEVKKREKKTKDILSKYTFAHKQTRAYGRIQICTHNDIQWGGTNIRTHMNV